MNHLSNYSTIMLFSFVLMEIMKQCHTFLYPSAVEFFILIGQNCFYSSTGTKWQKLKTNKQTDMALKLHRDLIKELEGVSSVRGSIPQAYV